MREMKDSGIEWIGEIPKNKQVLRNKYMLFYEKGKFPSSTNLDRKGFAYIGASDLDSNTNEYSTYTEDDTLPNAEYSDLLVLWDGARAGLCGTHKTGKISSTIVKIKADETVYQPLLYWYYKGFENFMYQSVNGTTIPHMNRKYIENIGFINWTIQEQQKISTYLDAKCTKIDIIIEKQQKIIEKLKAYKLSLITETVTKGLNPDVKMKDSDYEFIGTVPEHWNVCRLRNIGTPQNGISKGGDFFGHGYPFVSYGDVYRNFSLPETVNGLVETTEEEREQYSVKEGDIFFTRTSETIEEVGFSCVCEKTIENATFAGFVIRVRPFIDNLLTAFAKYYFRSNHHRFYLVKEMNLVTRASLGQNLLKSMPVLLPPKKEQQEIADYLDKKCSAIDSAIKKKQALIEKLTEYKKSLIYEVVTGKKEV